MFGLEIHIYIAKIQSANSLIAKTKLIPNFPCTDSRHGRTPRLSCTGRSKSATKDREKSEKERGREGEEQGRSLESRRSGSGRRVTRARGALSLYSCRSFPVHSIYEGRSELANEVHQQPKFRQVGRAKNEQQPACERANSFSLSPSALSFIRGRGEQKQK